MPNQKIIKAWGVLNKNNDLMYYQPTPESPQICSVFFTKENAKRVGIWNIAGEKIVPIEIKILKEE